MKVLIIEDEAPAFRRFEKLLIEIGDIEILEVLGSVTDCVDWLAQHQQPDLIFMDIQLNDGISFEIFDQVDIKSPVVFTTAFDEYMMRAFKVNSIDYLLKPINIDELKSSIAKFYQLKQSFSSSDQQVLIQDLVKEIRSEKPAYRDRFLIRIGDKMLAVETSQISHIYTQNGVVYLKTMEGKKHLMDHSLEEFGEWLNPSQFYRANRQFIVHIKGIEMAHRYHKGKLLVSLKHEDEPITVSAERASVFKVWFGGD
ncbi:MAG: response regulator transcription factor [Cyclobacteriaceae bacterium]